MYSGHLDKEKASGTRTSVKTTPREGRKQKIVANITGSKLKHSPREPELPPSITTPCWMGFPQGCCSPHNHQGKSPHITHVRGAELFLGNFALVTPTCGTPASKISFLSPWHPFQKHTLSVQPDFICVLSLSFFAYLMVHVLYYSLPPVTCRVLLACGLCHCLGQRRFRTSWFHSHFPSVLFCGLRYITPLSYV